MAINKINDRAYRLQFTEQAEKLVAQMTLEEKIKMINGSEEMQSMGIGDYCNVPPEGSGCERLGIETFKFMDGPRGVVGGNCTCFPVTMARGATFDPDLERKVGEAIGEELRVRGAQYYGGVCVNVPYHPGGGRSQECYGEDPFHLGTMGTALSQGIQNENVIACVKHFAFNSMENARFWVDVRADKRTEREIYLKQFQKIVENGAASVMCSYNSYQGKHASENAYLLQEVLRDEWGFDGFVMSDFLMALRHVAAPISAGMDVEMPTQIFFKEKFIKNALKKGKITEEELDRNCVRIARTLLAFQAARAEEKKKYSEKMICSKEHIALAREVAEKAITLVRNEDRMLPLNAKKTKRIALVGDLCKVENIGDHGSSMVHPPYVVTLYDAICKNYKGVKVDFIPTKKAASSKKKLKKADAVIVVAGCTHDDEGEFLGIAGGDRKDLHLKDAEVRMIKAAGKANKNTAVILMGGNVLITHEWKDDVAAVLYAYYPGMEGGNALADILFGKVNPSGHLPFAVAQSQKDYPKVNWFARRANYGYWHGYQKLDHDGKKPDYPYGLGLSYTTFDVGKVKLTGTTADTATFSVDVKNTGKRDGDTVIQLYVAFPGSRVERPERTLAAYRRVSVPAGKSRNVKLTVHASDIAWFDEKTNAFVEEDIKYIANIGFDEQSCTDHKVPFRFK